LVTALGADGDVPPVTSRLGELDARAGQLDARLAEVGQGLATLDVATVSRGEVEKALRDFDPVWDALVPREKAQLLALLVERVDYDGAEVAITFRRYRRRC
jgi:site-specific DNA recombinase